MLSLEELISTIACCLVTLQLKATALQASKAVISNQYLVPFTGKSNIPINYLHFNHPISKPIKLTLVFVISATTSSNTKVDSEIKIGGKLKHLTACQFFRVNVEWKNHSFEYILALKKGLTSDVWACVLLYSTDYTAKQAVTIL